MSENDINDKSKPVDKDKRPSPYAPKGISLPEMLNLYHRGYSYQQIADALGCNKSNVHKRLAPILKEIEDAKSYRKHRGDVFSVLQSMLLKSVDEDTIKKMSGLQRITGAGILYDKERLEGDKSTENIGISAHMKNLADIQRKIKELKKEMGINLDKIEEETE